MLDCMCEGLTRDHESSEASVSLSITMLRLRDGVQTAPIQHDVPDQDENGDTIHDETVSRRHRPNTTCWNKKASSHMA